MRKPTRKLAKTARVAASAMMATGLTFSMTLGTAHAADSQVSETHRYRSRQSCSTYNRMLWTGSQWTSQHLTGPLKSTGRNHGL